MALCQPCFPPKLFFGKADSGFKGFVDGARVEYYSKSYGAWIPAIIGDVLPSGCLKLLHYDGSVLKMQADRKSVRLASPQAKQGYDKQAKFNTNFEDRTLAICSQAARGMKQVNAKQSSSKTVGSEEAYDQQMEFLHSLSEKCNAQLKIDRGLSHDMVHDQHVDLLHLEARHILSTAVGPDMANAMRSSDELMRQMNFRHGFSSMYDQQLKLDRSLSESMSSQPM